MAELVTADDDFGKTNQDNLSPTKRAIKMNIMLKKKSIRLIGIIVLSTMMLAIILPEKAEQARRFLDMPEVTQTQGDGQRSRPVMHTFFEPSDGHPDGDELLKVWEYEWNRIGFDTKVLTMEDAKRHPLYKKMKKVVGPVFKETYNAFCFYRWLAMAEQKEGGWMSDFDAFPTRFLRDGDDGYDLPNGGELTSFDNHVPSLLSGSNSEWNRAAKLIIEYFPKTKGLKSDMMVWMTVRESQKDAHNIHFIPSPENMAKGFRYQSPRKIHCKALDQIRAVHISHKQTHDAYVAGNFPLAREDYKGRPEDNRAEAVKVYMNDYREQCSKSSTE